MDYEVGENFGERRRGKRSLRHISLDDGIIAAVSGLAPIRREEYMRV
jgi:hypothetical protein